jgi:hypothetical protein
MLIFPMMLHMVMCNDEGFQQEYKDSMAILVGFFHHLLLLLIVNDQVFEDASRFHGELKMLARQIIKTEYDISFWKMLGITLEMHCNIPSNVLNPTLKKGHFLEMKNLMA